MKWLYYLTVVSLTACYQTPEIDGFDQAKWTESLENCDGYRTEITALLLEKKSELISKNQNEVKALLGSAGRHELFERGQKFFYYQLDCDRTKELSIRFDAMGRVKELQVVLTQKPY